MALRNPEVESAHPVTSDVDVVRIGARSLSPRAAGRESVSKAAVEKPVQPASESGTTAVQTVAATVAGGGSQVTIAGEGSGPLTLSHAQYQLWVRKHNQ